jgi:nucleotide-binding universal stress UspA family protein
LVPEIKLITNLKYIVVKELLVHAASPAKDQLFLSFAANIARDLGASVRYLHILTPSEYPAGISANPGAAAAQIQQDSIELEEKAGHHLQLQIKKLNASDPDLPLLEYSIETGNPPDIFHEYCKNKRVCAIMLSGPKDRSAFLSDSTNINIIRKVKCPVWIIPKGITYKPFSEILYATDYHDEDLPNLKNLTRFASRFPAAITAVHITKDAGFQEKIKGEGFINMIKKETGYEMTSIKVLPEKGKEPLVTELHSFALMMDADLIVLLRENRRFTSRLIHGSHSEKIARETQLPVLIFNAERK